MTGAGAASSVAAALGDCATCGKHIYFGERCLTCIAEAKRSESSHPCLDCEDTILFGERCASCSIQHNRERLTSALAHPCRDCEAEILFGSRCRSCTGKDLDRRLASLVDLGKDGLEQGLRLAPAAKARLDALLGRDRTEAERAADAATEAAALERFTRTAQAWATSGMSVAVAGGAEAKGVLADLGERPIAAIGSAIETVAGIQRAKKALTHRGLDRLGRIPVTSELGRTSLEDLASAKLLEAAPGLAGSELIDDPAAALAALITLDHLYFITDLQLVEAEVEGAAPLTVLEALEAKSGTDPSATLACLTILESVRKVRRGEDLTRSLYDIQRALELLNPSAELGEEEPPAEPATEPAGAPPE
ncbi:MAG: hypothetical protein P1V81_16185 [Planctomycetota bacterium]|nr:hypothetical protein [Planctomycetota bacterium]